MESLSFLLGYNINDIVPAKLNSVIKKCTICDAIFSFNTSKTKKMKRCCDQSIKRCCSLCPRH